MYIDKNIARKSKVLNDRIQFYGDTNIPLMSEVEISDSGTCNRKCSFCPRSDPDYKDIKEFISKDLHDKIFKDLSSYNYTGMVIYSGYVEPLLNKSIYRNVAFARKCLPNAKIEIITNGDVLNLERLKKLFKAGLSTLLISVYDGPEDMVKFEKLMKEAELLPSQYVIRNRYMSADKDFGLTISNRSGMLKNAEYKIPETIEPLKENCTYPAYKFFIDYNGDVQMCSHDWGKKYVVGNLKDKSVIEIWLNKKFDKARKNLLNGNRNFLPCNKCDVSGELIGSLHAENWKKKYNSQK
jgi:radical SAM protein with 4Fe4S-binding SPASM domain